MRFPAPQNNKAMNKVIVLKIPTNDYKRPTEPRQEVVQAIVNALLRGCIYYQNETDRVKIDGNRFVRHNEPEREDNVKFYACEMQAAFDGLKAAGYHVFGCCVLGKGIRRVCSKMDFYVDEYGCKWKETFEFPNDIIE